VARAGDDEERLRERVATLRGQLQAHRDAGRETSDVRQQLDETVTRLAEVETERIAAEQALVRAEREATSARTVRERRLRLQDRAANLRRASRQHLGDELYDEFCAAVASIPRAVSPSEHPSEFEGDSVTVRLAAVAVADLDAPVVLSCDRFDSAETAVTRLNTPVVRV
jgi:hypothetical protein